MKTKDNRIDFVITWLDPSDENWIEDFKKHSKSPDDFSFERYRDWGTLKYWFRGVERFAPWVGNVFFVTYGHIPSWLNLNHEKLRVVYHKDFIPKKYLPTFSSHPIEWNFHRIEQLSDTFVYFNDDTFLIDAVPEEDFFVDGIPCDFFIETAVCQDDYNNNFAHILLNNSGIINKYFDKQMFKKNYHKLWFNSKYGVSNIRNVLMSPYKYFSGFKYSHLPSSLLKQTYDELWNIEYDLLDKVCSHKFRSMEDVNQYLVSNWQCLKGSFVPCRIDRGLFLTIGKDNEKIICSIKNQSKKMICINDSDYIDYNDIFRSKLDEAFMSILPEKSKYELD